MNRLNELNDCSPTIFIELISIPIPIAICRNPLTLFVFRWWSFFLSFYKIPFISNSTVCCNYFFL